MQDPDEFGMIALGEMMDLPRDVMARVKKTCEPLIEGNDMPTELQENGISDFPDPLPTGGRGTMTWEKPGAIGSAPANFQEVLALCNRKLGNGPR